MKDVVVIAVVQEPMAALDGETWVEVFNTDKEATAWVEEKLKFYDTPGAPYTREEVNWNLYYRKIETT